MSSKGSFKTWQCTNKAKLANYSQQMTVNHEKVE